MADDNKDRERPRTVDPDEVGETKFTGRGMILGVQSPTTDMQQPTRPHSRDLTPRGPQPIEEPPEPSWPRSFPSLVGRPRRG